MHGMFEDRVPGAEIKVDEMRGSQSSDSLGGRHRPRASSQNGPSELSGLFLRLLLEALGLRRGSRGHRKFELLAPMTVTLVSRNDMIKVMRGERPLDTERGSK